MIISALGWEWAGCVRRDFSYGCDEMHSTAASAASSSKTSLHNLHQVSLQVENIGMLRKP